MDKQYTGLSLSLLLSVVLQAVTGEVLVRCTFKGARTPKPVSTPAGPRGIIPALHSYDAEGELEPLPAAPVLHWLQVNRSIVCGSLYGVFGRNNILEQIFQIMHDNRNGIKSKFQFLTCKYCHFI